MIDFEDQYNDTEYDNDLYTDDYFDHQYELDRLEEIEDRFFDRWGYYPDEETEEQKDTRLALEEQEKVLESISQEFRMNSSVTLGPLIFEAFTKGK